MKNIITFYSGLIFLLMLNTMDVNAQGWSRSIFSSSIPGFSSNEVVTAAAYQNGRSLALGLSYKDFGIVPSGFYVDDALGGVGFTSGVLPEGIGNDIVHVPITIINGNNPLDSAYYLFTQRSLPGDDTYYLNLSKFQFFVGPFWSPAAYTLSLIHI